MLLVIDVGNTNIVFGVYDNDELLYDWRIATEKNRTSDEYGFLFSQIFAYHNLDIASVENVIISSVVPTLMHTLSSMSEKYLDRKPLIVGHGINLGMEIKYDNPKEVGADRIVNSVAAYDKYGGPLIVVDFGTAITFDVISEKGEYLGGSIVPGIIISTDALFSRTAKLPKIEIEKPEKVIGKNTINSMQSGIVNGYIGLVDYLLEKIMEELESEGHSKVENIIATGGFSALIANESKYINKIDKMLALEGMKLIHDLNK